jgi:alpha-L-rhamnosidase
MKIRKVLFVLLLLQILLCKSTFSQNNKVNSSIVPIQLKCEYLNNPLGIDELKPRLSWICKANSPQSRGLAQTAYQIIVATSEELLKNDQGDIWDSGKVLSDKSVFIEYSGKPLVSHTRYFWKVRIFDQEGRSSGWSDPSFWVTGLLSPDEWKARWISWQPASPQGTPIDPHGSVSPWLRKNFDLSAKPVIALAYINVVGYIELYVNGKKVGDDLLTPAVSDYAARSFYVTYDITSYLQTGGNCIALWLGRGWYDPEAAYKDLSRGPGPRARVQCEMVVGDKQVSVLSDRTWKAAASPYTTLGLYQWNAYHGENYDANMENPQWNLPSFDDSPWENVREVASPSPIAQAQPCPLNRIGQRFTPVTITDLGQDRYEIDFGTDLTGGFKFRFPQLEKGKTIKFHYADEKRNIISDKGSVPEGTKDSVAGSYKELVFPGKDGKPNAYQSMRQYDVYVPSGKLGEVFQTKFNYHGFRYVVIENLPSAPARQDAEATLIESDLESVGSFSCSNKLFNRILAANNWTLRCLNLGGYLSDCPHRERLGYGDHHVSIETNIMNFWMPAFYQKWIRDWRDAQDPETGMIPHSAPQRIGGGGPAWEGTLQALTWRQYLYYGDKRILEDNYNACRRYLDDLETYCKNGVLRIHGGRWDFLGDWVAPHRGMDTKNWPPPTPTAAEFFNNCYRVYLWDQLERMATVLSRTNEMQYCKAKIDTIRPLIHTAFYDAGKQLYVLDEQVHQVMPLMSGVVPYELRETIIKKLENSILIKNNGHLDTGMWGTYFMIQYLQETGRNDLIYSIMNQETYPGWGYMLSQGATTFWEQWNGFYSRIHSCYTSPGGWFYQGLAGIRVDETAPGFKKIVIKPAIVGDLKWVRAKHNSSYGSIESSWEFNAGKVTMNVTVPPNTTATIYVPTTDVNTVKENGTSISESPNVKFIHKEKDYAVYGVGSGSYVFSSINR